MLRIEINPARLERIVLDGRSEMERDFDLAAYQTLKPLIERIDRRLKRAVQMALKMEPLPR
jgi:hypothetical protein